MEEQELLQIGEVAARAGLSLRTIRHYDDVGLVTPSGRTTGGFRLYSVEDVERLEIVKGMKPAGLTLEEMRELLDLLESPGSSAGDGSRGRTARLEHFLAATGEQAERLDRYLREVKKLNRRVRTALRAPARERVRR